MESQTKTIPMELEDGTVIQVEASILGGEEDVLDYEQVIPFKAVTDTLERIASSIHSSLEKVQPDKAAVEFGIEVGVEAGALTALLTKGTGKANLKITLEWERNVMPAD
jgi:hypothetical protein